jgi:hypothetical protein
VLDDGASTGARVRVLIESTDGTRQWGTVGLSSNVIEASWQALLDSVEFKLHKDKAQPRLGKSAESLSGNGQRVRAGGAKANGAKMNGAKLNGARSTAKSRRAARGSSDAAKT